MHSILVKDYMNTAPHTLSETSTVRDAVELFLKYAIHGAPVVNSDHHLVGFVSEQDCLSEMLNEAFYCEESPSIAMVMSKTVHAISPEASILSLAESMAKAPPKNYPVTERNKLIGLISRKDILKALVENDEDCYIHH